MKTEELVILLLLLPTPALPRVHQCGFRHRVLLLGHVAEPAAGVEAAELEVPAQDQRHQLEACVAYAAIGALLRGPCVGTLTVLASDSIHFRVPTVLTSASINFRQY